MATKRKRPLRDHVSPKRTNANRLAGKRFGRLLVTEETDRRTIGGHIIWACRCDCGAEVEVPGHNLRSGNTVSCGCYFREHCAEFARKSRGRKA